MKEKKLVELAELVIKKIGPIGCCCMTESLVKGSRWRWFLMGDEKWIEVETNVFRGKVYTALPFSKQTHGIMLKVIRHLKLICYSEKFKEMPKNPSPI